MAESRPCRVLIAEDDPDLLSLFQVVLENEGYVVDLARDGDEALRKASALRPDVMVLDINMPRLNGWVVLSRLQSSVGAPPTVVISGMDERQRARSAGVAACLVKPFRFWDLLEACARAVGLAWKSKGPFDRRPQHS